LLNGPNLGRLGRRRIDVYATATLTDIEESVRAEVEPDGWTVTGAQHDSEGDLIGTLDQHRDAAGAIVNPGALMIAGWSLRDALEEFAPPWVEVHLSNVWAREPFRHQSITAGLASGVIMGLGGEGYRLAARALIRLASR
jgi:5-deoxy-5-amino-3-dehydroquinate dehydratase